MGQLSPAFLEPLASLLRDVFGSKIELASYQVLNEQRDYCVLLVETTQPMHEVIVKLAGRASTMDANFERTASLHQTISTHTDIPVAEIIAVDSSYARYPWRYMIQTRLRGTVWAQIAPELDAMQKQDALAQIGQAVAQLHNVTFSTFGEIDTDEKDVPFIDALLRRVERSIQQPHLRKRFAEVVSERRGLFETIKQPTLCHDDLHHYNVLFQREQAGWRLEGILDFDKAWAGHFETDLARLEFWDNMMGDAFREVYAALHGYEVGYEQRRLVHQLMWCLEYARPTARHVADLRRVCQGLGIAPIAL